MRKNSVFGVVILCLTMMAVGCGSGTEGSQPTVAVSPTEGVVTESPTPTEDVATALPVPTEAVITEQPMPTKAAAVVAEGIPIDEEHFGDEVFCKLLKRLYDLDENGSLSEEELGNVKSLTFPPGTPVGTLKGFSHFSNLESVVLPPAERVEFVGVPSLKKVSNNTTINVKQRYINYLIVSDCPELEQMVFTDVTVGGEENDSENFLIENCPRLELLEFSQSGLSTMRGRITEAPALTVEFGWSTDEPEKLVMDGEVTVADGSLEYDYEQRKPQVEERLPYEWTTEENDARAAAWQELRETREDIRKDFSLTVEPVVPARYDENGAQAFYVLVDHPRIERDLYQYLYEDYYGIPTPSYAVVYEKELPKAEQFAFDWSGSEHYKIHEYSPVNEVKGEYYGEFAVCRLTADGKEPVANFGVSLGYAFNVQGEMKLSSWGYTCSFDEIPTDGVWITQRSETVAPTEDDIRIDKEHFSGVFMRRYVEEVIDTDGNGYLSVEEREAVTEIDMFEMEMGLDVIDGFEWFPNLESISMPYCTKMEIRNCPKLVRVGAGEGSGAGELIIENCPELDELGFLYAGVSNLYIKDCEKLRYITGYCSWDVGTYDTVWEFENCPNLTVASGGAAEFGQLFEADANEVSVCFGYMWHPEISYKDGMFYVDGKARIVWKNLPEQWFLPSEELLEEAFVTDVLKENLGFEELSIKNCELLVYSPGKGADYQVRVVPGNAEQENEKKSWVRCCIWITPEKEAVFYDSYETWNEERMPGWSQWY